MNTIKWGITETGLYLAGRKIVVTRGQLILLMVAINQAFLALDIYLAHVLNGNIHASEWIPIIFGPIAAVILLIAGVISLRRRTMAILLAFGVFAVSLVIGLLGAYFHLDRGFPPLPPQNAGRLFDILVYAPPILGPLTFSLVAVFGVIAAVKENPPNSGHMIVPGLFSWRVPFNKTQQYVIWVCLGILATLLSSVFDHGRFNLENVWVWLPIVASVFAIASSLAFSLMQKPNTHDYGVYIGSMLILIVVGLIGSALHIGGNLTSRGDIIVERFLRGAPFLAPLLFANMATFGLIAIWPIEEAFEDEES